MGGVSRLLNYVYTQSSDKMCIYQIQKLINDHSVATGVKVILFFNKDYVLLRNINIDTF